MVTLRLGYHGRRIGCWWDTSRIGAHLSGSVLAGQGPGLDPRLASARGTARGLAGRRSKRHEECVGLMWSWCRAPHHLGVGSNTGVGTRYGFRIVHASTRCDSTELAQRAFLVEDTRMQ